MRQVLTLLLLSFALGSAQAATLRVRPGDSLQQAINAAAAGDVLEIERGLYVGNFVVDKPLTLRGRSGQPRPTLSGAQRGDTLRISAPDVLIEGLILRDSGDSLKDQNAGVYIRPGAHRATVLRCDLTYNLFGLWIEKANHVRVEANLI
ncbi:MAG TPA: nitrous oxide reductase family maturation protein NosD, partial [Roseateles sp.]|nr:nitrous oxide reductase family maturation protein NosD [Roseateles sp.]